MRLCCKSPCWNWLLRPSQIKNVPVQVQPVGHVIPRPDAVLLRLLGADACERPICAEKLGVKSDIPLLIRSSPEAKQPGVFVDGRHRCACGCETSVRDQRDGVVCIQRAAAGKVGLGDGLRIIHHRARASRSRGCGRARIKDLVQSLIEIVGDVPVPVAESYSHPKLSGKAVVNLRQIRLLLLFQEIAVDRRMERSGPEESRNSKSVPQCRPPHRPAGCT